MEHSLPLSGLLSLGGELFLEELGPGGQWDNTTRSRFSMGEDLETDGVKMISISAPAPCQRLQMNKSTRSWRRQQH